MRWKGRAIVIAVAAVVGAGALMIVPFTNVLTIIPFANAETKETPEQLMNRCNRAMFLDGKRQNADINNGYQATSCDLVDRNFTEFHGEPLRVSRRLRNCPPDLFKGGKALVRVEASLEQGGGKSTWTEIGSNSGLLGVLTANWRSYEGTRDLTTKTIVVRFDTEVDLPQNRIVTFTFAPKMLRMTANWHVVLDGYDGYPGGRPNPDRINEKVTEEVIGPLLLPSGLPDGTLTVDTSEKCPKKT